MTDKIIIARLKQLANVETVQRDNARADAESAILTEDKIRYATAALIHDARGTCYNEVLSWMGD